MIMGICQLNNGTRRRVKDLCNERVEINLCVFIKTSSQPAYRSIYTRAEIPAKRESAPKIVPNVIRLLQPYAWQS